MFVDLKEIVFVLALDREGSLKSEARMKLGSWRFFWGSNPMN